ncbi:hypothetical protein SLEP1_g31391 [Rubroshorea leprosula]|uniref:Legume lectin domain-containing protein n=1 Tax=Rubroshorea leprosula TaxID=152421 RepID=A0AAV5K373_9ROSI|nr:hypothetical protein SLEP1_g31391 [Rubroshorea leprosula]
MADQLLGFLFLITIDFKPRSFLTSPKNVTFDFQSFTLCNLTFLSDFLLQKDIVSLTQELGVPFSSFDTVIYNYPIPFFDKESNTKASFHTRFSFLIKNFESEFFW